MGHSYSDITDGILIKKREYRVKFYVSATKEGRRKAKFSRVVHKIIRNITVCDQKGKIQYP